MDSILSNLSGRVRHETMQGREFLVAPLTMVVEGVLNGSNGPLFYPRDELKRTARDWNGMPVVVNHPLESGRPITARSPKVLDQYQIGTVHNAEFSGNKLRAEAWIDVELCRRVEPKILDALKRGKPLEVSTGLGVDRDVQAGTFNGRSYVAVARNHKPDHLAILPNTVGACSLKDGCGCGIANERLYSKSEWFNRIGRALESVQTVCNERCDCADVLPLPPSTNLDGSITGTEMLRRMGLDKADRSEVEAEQRRRTVSGLDNAQWALAAQEARMKQEKGSDLTDLEWYVLKAEEARQMAKLAGILPPPPATSM